MKRYVSPVVALLYVVLVFAASYEVTTLVVSGDNKQVYTSPFCHTIDSIDKKMPNGFGSPVYQHGYSKGRVIMNVYCLDTGAFLTVGTGHSSLLVYRYGYEWVDGAWSRIEFWGNLAENPSWLVGSGVVQLSAQQEDYRTTNSVVAYTCVLEDNTYKCGCRDTACTESYWQLQQFGTDKPIVVTAVPSVTPGEGVMYRDDTVYVTKLDPRVVSHGETILITGANYDREANTLHFGDQQVHNVSAESGGVIRFTVPAHIEPGWYDVHVSNALGKSEYGQYVVVTAPGAVAPVVDRIQPTEVAPGDTITLRGKGFTDEDNVIYTTFKVFPGIVSKDGNTITFTYDPFTIPKEYAEYYDDEPLRNIDPVTHEPDPISWPVDVWVANANGESNKVEVILTY